MTLGHSGRSTLTRSAGSGIADRGRGGRANRLRDAAFRPIFSGTRANVAVMRDRHATIAPAKRYICARARAPDMIHLFDRETGARL